jgi:hypothetical protein
MPSPHRPTANDIEKHRCVTRHVMRKYNNVAQLRHLLDSNAFPPVFSLFVRDSRKKVGRGRNARVSA